MRMMKSVKKMRRKLPHKDHLEQFFIGFRNLLLRHYNELYEKHKMSNTNLLTTDVSTRWNSTYPMIITTWDKMKVLNVMETTSLKYGKIISLIMLEERDLLKIFINELLTFQETTELFSKSRAITLPNIMYIFDFC